MHHKSDMWEGQVCDRQKGRPCQTKLETSSPVNPVASAVLCLRPRVWHVGVEQMSQVQRVWRGMVQGGWAIQPVILEMGR